MVTLTPDSEKFSWVSSCGLQSHFPQGGKVTSDHSAQHKVGSKTIKRGKKKIYNVVSINFVEHPQLQFPVHSLEIIHLCLMK